MFFFLGLRPGKKGVPKCPQNKKKQFFGVKNVKFFETGIHFFFSTIFHPTNAAENTLYTKSTFVKKTVKSKKSLKFPKKS